MTRMWCHKLLCQVALVTSLIFLISPDALFAQGSPDIIWKRQVSVDRVNSVIFTPDGNTLISGGSDRLINLWRVSDGTLLQTLNTNAPFVHASAIESLSITPDASLLASCSYKIIQLWSLPSGTQRVLNGHTDWVVGVAFSPDGSLLASASFDTTVRIWRSSDGSLLKVLQGSGQQRCVAFSPDGSLLAATSADNSVVLWRTSDWTIVQTLRGHSDDIFVVAFSPDGTTLASGGYDDTVKLWNVADGSLRYTFDGNGGNVYSLAFTPDSSKLAYTDGEGSTVKIYDVSTGALLRTFTSEVNEVQTVAFSRDGLLGYGRVDETVVLARINSSSSARISSPAIGTTYNAPANITIVASPSKSSGIVRMEFFQNGTKLGEDLAPPFTFNWTDVPAGTYVLTVVDTDSAGATTESGPVTINVVDKTDVPPSVSITSPKPGATFSEPVDITITASATASAGVASVEFFQDGISLGQDTKAPFTMIWNSVPMGNYSLTAVVTDKAGATATSAPIDISVGEAPPESVKPRVVIRSPASNARLNVPDVTITGTASDNVGVAQVLYSINSEAFRPAEGTETWEATLGLQPGPNVVQVKSVDTSGNESAIVSRTFTYIVSSPLSVTVNGLGTVSIKDGQILQVGKTYTIRAKPTRDSVFNGWTGSITNNASAITFVMTENMALVANFVSNPFAETAGTYLGLIQSPTPSNERSGSVRVNTTRRGTFSGRIVFGGKNYSVNGKFNGDGSFSADHSRSALSLNLLLHLDDNSDQITGTITDGTASATLVADRMVFNARTNPAEAAGKYTVLIPPDSTNQAAPQGNGFGTVTVDASGRVRVAGSLADGTKFSQASGISKNGDWPFYVSLYRRQGSIFGPIKFRDQPEVSDLDGAVDWFRPASSKAKIFADGFVAETLMLGSTYVRPSNEPVLTVPDSEENVVVNLGKGDLDEEVQTPVRLEANNKFVVPNSNEKKLRITVSPSTGAVRGSFIHPVTGRNTRHSGIVFQKQNLAEGYFLGTDQSGFVSVVPTDGNGFSEGDPNNVPPPDTADPVPAEDAPPVLEEPATPLSPAPTEPAPTPKRKRKH